MSAIFTYRRAVETNCFLQVPFLSATDLTSAATARALLNVPVGMRWEALDQDNILPPVAYVAGEGHAGAENAAMLLAGGDLLLREEVGYLPWSENRIRPLYGHWQLITLVRIHDAVAGAKPLGLLSGGIDGLREYLQRAASSHWEGLQYADADKNLELVLTRAQSFFLPAVRGTWLAGAFFEPDGTLSELDAHAWIKRERRRTDFAAALSEVGIDAAALEQRFEWLMQQAERRDPVERWRVLVEAIPRRKIEQLNGDALVARDFYDAAFVLAAWHRAVSERDLLAELEETEGFRASRGEVNKRLYGYEVTAGNRAALPGVLEEFGLYPWRVALIAEGDSDISMLESIYDAWWKVSLDSLGIVAIDMGGSGLPKKKSDRERLVRMLAALRRFPNYFFLLFDDENNAAEFVRELERRTTGYEPFGRMPILESDPWKGKNPAREGWTGQEYVPLHSPERHVWNVDLEADNFTLPEICAVINEMAHRDPKLAKFDLTVDELATAHRVGTKGIASVAVKLAAARGFDRLTKPDLAAELGRLAVAHRELNGEVRPVLKVAEHVRRLANAHRQLRGRLREQERGKLRNRA